MRGMKKVLSIVVLASMVLAGGNLLSGIANASSDTEVQTITLSVTSTLTMTLADGTVDLGTLTPGVANTATTSLSVTTNEYNGWYLSVKRDDAVTTLNMNGVAIPNVTYPDAAGWTYASPNATTSANVGANLSFRVLQTGTDAALYDAGLWGANDALPSALLAGFPITSQRIAGVASYVAVPQTVAYEFRADAPGTQQSGAYSGTITFTALSTP